MYLAKLKYEIKLKCPKHPKFNPETMGVAAIKAGCGNCQALLIVAQKVMEIRRMLDVFTAEANRTQREMEMCMTAKGRAQVESEMRQRLSGQAE